MSGSHQVGRLEKKGCGPPPEGGERGSVMGDLGPKRGMDKIYAWVVLWGEKHVLVGLSKGIHGKRPHSVAWGKTFFGWGFRETTRIGKEDLNRKRKGK